MVVNLNESTKDAELGILKNIAAHFPKESSNVSISNNSLVASGMRPFSSKIFDKINNLLLIYGFKCSKSSTLEHKTIYEYVPLNDNVLGYDAKLVLTVDLSNPEVYLIKIIIDMNDISSNESINESIANDDSYRFIKNSIIKAQQSLDNLIENLREIPIINLSNEENKIFTEANNILLSLVNDFADR